MLTSGVFFLLGLLAFIGGGVLFPEGSRAMHNMHVLSVLLFVVSAGLAFMSRVWAIVLAALIMVVVVGGITFGWI